MDATLASFWDEMLISYYDNPFIPQDIVPPDATCENVEDDAWLVYDPRAPRPDEDFDGSAYMTLCPESRTFKFCVSLDMTENPPDWGRVGGVASGAPEWGFGCEGLQGRDTSLMKVVGTTVLHEFFHWPKIFRDVPGYDTWIRVNGYNGPQIIDTSSNAIPNPYGPWNTMRINQLPPDPASGKSQSIQNAENYVWYALSKYCE